MRPIPAFAISVFVSLGAFATVANATTAAQHQCDVASQNCWFNADHCMNIDACRSRCDQKYQACLSASDTHGPPTTGGIATFPNGGVGSTPPSRLQLNSQTSSSGKSNARFSPLMGRWR